MTKQKKKSIKMHRGIHLRDIKNVIINHGYAVFPPGVRERFNYVQKRTLGNTVEPEVACSIFLESVDNNILLSGGLDWYQKLSEHITKEKHNKMSEDSKCKLSKIFKLNNTEYKRSDWDELHKMYPKIFSNRETYSYIAKQLKKQLNDLVKHKNQFIVGAAIHTSIGTLFKSKTRFAIWHQDIKGKKKQKEFKVVVKHIKDLKDVQKYIEKQKQTAKEQKRFVLATNMDEVSYYKYKNDSFSKIDAASAVAAGVLGAKLYDPKNVENKIYSSSGEHIDTTWHHQDEKGRHELKTTAQIAAATALAGLGIWSIGKMKDAYKHFVDANEYMVTIITYKQ